MAMQPWPASSVRAQEPRRERITPALTRDLTRRPLASSGSELALGRARTAMAAQDFATAYKEYRAAADTARGVAGLEKVRAEAVRGLCESGVKLAQQRKAQGKIPEAEQILREILSAQYNPRYGPALELLATLRFTAAPRIQGFTTTRPSRNKEKSDTREIPPTAPPASTPRTSGDASPRRATPPPIKTERATPPPAPTVATSPAVPMVTSSPPLPAASPAAAPEVVNPLVKVYFATDRSPTGKRGPSNYFGIDWNKTEEPLITGVVTVSIPPVHKEGHVERPGKYFFVFDESEDIKKHFVLTKLRPIKGDDFYGELRGDFERLPEKDRSAFVYIHGYNVTFDEAAYDTAQIVYDLKFKGVPMMFSWPSQGEALAYDGDQETVEFSWPNLQAFLERVARESRTRRIHVMAHSMGNRLLTRALQELVRQPDIQPLFENVIMASPDVNARVFTGLWPRIKVAAKRFTLYASSDDNALVLSRKAKGGSSFTRLGEGGPNIAVIPGLDTIDASGIDTSHLGHSYEVECKPVRDDLGMLIGEGSGPEKRNLFDHRNNEGLGYWSFH
jgi:esterase/lipase superfamily enzyme